MTSDIIILLDESGSMSVMQTEPVDAMNSFIQEQKTIPGSITIATFSDVLKKHVSKEDIQKIGKFENYRPEGLTSLYDAICISINENIESKNVQLVVITDGEDTSSKLYSLEQTRAMIEKMEKENNWKVSFLASGLGVNASKSLGINPLTFGGDDDTQYPAKLQEVMRQVSQRISSQRLS